MSDGFGVLVNRLFGYSDEARLAYSTSVGKTIASVELADDKLAFSFTDGTTLKLYDDGQSCCESRYMQTDDDLPYYVGATFNGIELRDAPDVTSDEPYAEEHQVQFLVVLTDRGTFSMASHVVHNGYYGGFSITASK